ncbi:MAG: PIN domain-containing protein [Saprospiraceae bacterium]|nr:PIN domain-containing protein [Saprospiraceae bacterium]
MKIYLDSCSLQRPFDDQAQVRIATETTAILGTLALWESDKIILVGSEALEYEAAQIPSLERKEYMNQVLTKVQQFVDISNEVEARAKYLVQKGVRPLDSLHLACAEEANVTYFCTCDDKFLKKAKLLAKKTIEVVSPLELATKLPQ